MGAPLSATVASLQREISACERQLELLRAQLADAEAAAAASASYTEHDDALLSSAIDGGFPVEWQGETMAALAPPHTHTHTHAHTHNTAAASSGDDDDNAPTTTTPWPLSAEEYRRYGRQLIMPEVGLRGQQRLRAARVLVVGAGGLGCPAAAYLAGAGVGALGLVDGDTVEESNLHRQILHSSLKVGMGKVESAVASLRALNPLVRYHTHRHRLAPSNALALVADYDVVLDCTDTPASRYLISDACVLQRKPLVSASALRTEGQLMVLNSPARAPGDPTGGGPCYRCVFPRPPPPETVVSCGEGGILGPVVGVMGVLQALETIKLIASGGLETDLSSTATPTTPPPTPPNPPAKPSLLLFSSTAHPPFRSVTLRARKPTCATCSAQATITPAALTSGSLDYVQFCGLSLPISTLAADERLAPAEYAAAVRERRPHVLLDVRERVQFELAHLRGSVNVPWSVLGGVVVGGKGMGVGGGLGSGEGKMGGLGGGGERDREQKENNNEPAWLQNLRALPTSTPIVVACRLGNDSQLAVRKLQALGLGGGGGGVGREEEGMEGVEGASECENSSDGPDGDGEGEGRRRIVDLRGGLSAWRRDVDAGFPDY
ncbi:uncharacterized protein K452DRAFT_360051 [Aplosporella prunicola CBS 121167]|uniref:Adenylyltransferase and sulfurtransferase uba4 n=1 Tax=Aplosporella prunicola CBS 121167 TaxID=1176127 RepID=A0A6A6B919_9PEZI|nr:uncharacterized protein K452DRAFT_360051 [Aplosporella prunicola CBS 121167]KAF2139795.1 hypothetical protein K452DRAFT_360051 [Aplosporella prunicola CBS 121167]